MNKKICLVAALVALAPLSLSRFASADSNPPQPSDTNNFAKSPSVQAPPSKVTNKPPTEVVEQAKIGTIHNPYTGKADMIAEGKKVFFGAGCNGCHGGGGGGGICPSVKNETWVYGSDDDTLFRLITLGSDGLASKGYQRKGRESVTAPMPPFGSILKSDDELFKVMAFLRSLYKGDEKRVNW